MPPARLTKPALVLRGHRSTSFFCALSADGAVAVSTSLDKTARVWDTASGVERCVLSPHASWVKGCAISADAAVAATASGDGHVRVWDAEEGHLLYELRRERYKFAHHCALTPDGHTLVATFYSGSADKIGEVVMVDWRLGVVVAAWDMQAHLYECAVSRDASIIACTWMDRSGKCGIHALNTASEAMSVVRSWRAKRYSGLTMDAEGRRIVKADADALTVYDVHDLGDAGRECEGYVGSFGGTSYCALTPDGTRVLSAVKDNAYRMWDVESGTLLATLEGHGGGATGCALSPDGSVVVCCSWDTAVRVWHLADALREAEDDADSSRTASALLNGPVALPPALPQGPPVLPLETLSLQPDSELLLAMEPSPTVRTPAQPIMYTASAESLMSAGSVESPSLELPLVHEVSSMFESTETDLEGATLATVATESHGFDETSDNLQRSSRESQPAPPSATEGSTTPGHEVDLINSRALGVSGSRDIRRAPSPIDYPASENSSHTAPSEDSGGRENSDMSVGTSDLTVTAISSAASVHAGATAGGGVNGVQQKRDEVVHRFILKAEQRRCETLSLLDTRDELKLVLLGTSGQGAKGITDEQIDDAFGEVGEYGAVRVSEKTFSLMYEVLEKQLATNETTQVLSTWEAQFNEAASPHSFLPTISAAILIVGFSMSIGEVRDGSPKLSAKNVREELRSAGSKGEDEVSIVEFLDVAQRLLLPSDKV